MDINRSETGKYFVIWMVANILGFCALGGLALVLPLIVHFSSPIITVFVIALPISIAQWIALRYLLKTSAWWILTAPIGILLGQVIINFWPSNFWPSADDESIVNLAFIFLLVGLSVGLLQWLLLRRSLSRALFWILASAVGVAGSIWFILVTDLINQSGVMAFIVAVAVYTIITGLTLSGLLASTKKPEAYPVDASLSKV